MSLRFPETKGAIALTSMVVLGAVITMIIVSMVLLGISSRMNSFNSRQASLAYVRAEGCLEEALLQLSRDDEYVGGDYSIDGNDCEVNVEGTDDERTLRLHADDGDYSLAFTLVLQIDPSFVILDFDY